MKAIDQSEFNSEVGGAEYVIIDFWAEWCGPCRVLTPRLEELSKDYLGKVKFLKVDVDANADLAGKLQIRGIPTLLFFKNGKQVKSLVGVHSLDRLNIEIKDLLSTDTL